MTQDLESADEKTALATVGWKITTKEVSARQIFIQSAANGKYVSAELGYTGGSYAMLRARADQVLGWEQFNLFFNGSHYALQSAANGKYVSAELGYGGGIYAMLRARADQRLDWEKFFIPL